jgi:hypothetical protein
MPLQPFDVRQVRAGEPVTAQAWNDIVNAIGDLHGFVEATTGSRLQVRVAGPSLDTDAVRVSAIAADGAVTDAAAPVPPSDGFTLADLLPGSYTIRAEARGFTPATAATTVPAPAPVVLTLSRSSPAMPVVFGLTLEQALAALRTAAIVPARVVDITGRDVPPANPGAEFNSTLVLVQLPPPGYPVAADSGSAQLVVSAALEVEATIEMPSLAGLTLVEARRVLDELGLVLGNVQTRNDRPG